MYPNPNNTGYITISNSNELNSIVIYDILEKRVKQIIFNKTSNDESINITDLNKGVYIVKTTNIIGNIESKKLIVN